MSKRNTRQTNKVKTKVFRWETPCTVPTVTFFCFLLPMVMQARLSSLIFTFSGWKRQYSPTYSITIHKVLRSICIEVRPAVDEKNVGSSITAFNNLQRNENPRNSWYCFILVKISSLSMTKTTKKVHKCSAAWPLSSEHKLRIVAQSFGSSRTISLSQFQNYILFSTESWGSQLTLIYTKGDLQRYELLVKTWPQFCQCKLEFLLRTYDYKLHKIVTGISNTSFWTVFKSQE